MQAEQLLVAPSQAGLRLTRLDLVNHEDVPIDCIASYPTCWIYKRNGHENINCPRSCFTSSPNLRREFYRKKQTRLPLFRA